MPKLYCRCLLGLVLLLCGGWLPLGTPAFAAETSAPDSDSCLAIPTPDTGLLDVELERQQQALFREHHGKTIGNIRFRNANVFDEANEDENNPLFLFLNRLHMHTRKDVIAAQLLFEPGDTLHAGDVAESERILRGRNYLANAHIVVERVCDDRVDLVVYTQDSWTTEPQISFGRSGGETSSGFTLYEGNILGTGNSIAVGYDQDADRSGVNYYFSSDHFLNSRFTSRFGYSDNSDGEDSLVEIAMPFYSLKTPVAYGFRSETLNQVDPIRWRGEIVNEYRHSIEHHEVFYGRALAIDESETHRLLAGLTKERDTFSATEETVGAVPIATDILYPWLEYQFLEHEYAVYHNLDQIQRVEDVAMGKELTLRVGYGGESLGNDDDVVRFNGYFSDILEVTDNHIVRFSANLDGKRYSSLEYDPAVLGGEVSYYLLSDRNNRWFARVRFDFGRELQEHEMLTVGGTVGVRGYPLDYQRGNRRYIASIERRYFSDLHLFNLFRLGGVVFADAGRAWDNSNRETVDHLANVGFGFRLSSSKAKIGHVVHVDLAFPLVDAGDVDDMQLLLKAEQTF